MTELLALLTGLFWTTSYILIIRSGVRDKTYGMPIVAFTINICWEFIFAFLRPDHGGVIEIVWLLCDCVIGYTMIKYGPREFPQISPRIFYAGLAALLVISYPAVNLVSLRFDAGEGNYAALLANLLMSIMFVAMLVARRGSRGQTVPIAVTKMIGTACASGVIATRPNQPERFHGGLPIYLYLTCFVIDLFYICVLVAVKRRERANAEGVTERITDGTVNDVTGGETTTDFGASR